MIHINVKVEGLDRVRKELAKLSGPAMRQATADALNDAAYDVRRRYREEMRRVFDRPTPYIIKHVDITKATPDNLQATIGPRAPAGKGTDPEKVLAAQLAGGTRRDKRSESALRRVGILQSGYMTVIPAEPFPGSVDGYGNIKGSFMVRLLSYLRAFGEQGYRANMSDKRRAKIAKRGLTKDGYTTINGYELFVAYGKLRSGRSAHLAYGIWARSGIQGAVLRPVLMFVRTPMYSKRLDLEKIARSTEIQSVFERRLRFRIRRAVGV